MDAANVDLKAFTEDFYKNITLSHLQPILDTLIYIYHHTKVWLEITTLLIPGKNDSEAEIKKLTKWIIDNLGPDVPIHFTAFHPAWKMPNIPPTPIETLTRAREIAINHGIYYAYTGNVYDKKGSSTYCHNCGTCIIERDYYTTTGYQLTDKGDCTNCGTTCHGVFDKSPGNWEGRRQPIYLKGTS